MTLENSKGFAGTSNILDIRFAQLIEGDALPQREYKTLAGVPPSPVNMARATTKIIVPNTTAQPAQIMKYPITLSNFLPHGIQGN